MLINSRSATPSDTANIEGPSNTTLSQLAGIISSLNNHLKERDAVLADTINRKKNKFLSWPENRKRILLNIMSVNGIHLADNIPEALLNVINQKLVSRAKEEIEALLAQENCICEILLAFALAIQTGDFVVWNSEEPGKFSVFALGMNKSFTRNRR